MNRKSFVILSSLGGLGILQSLYLSSCTRDERIPILAVPESLVPICEPETLQKIGRQDLEMFPEENEQSVLSEFLIDGFSGSKDVLTAHLETRIAEEYRQGTTIEVAGWLLSRTEARQCALYSLLKS